MVFLLMLYTLGCAGAELWWEPPLAIVLRVSFPGAGPSPTTYLVPWAFAAITLGRILVVFLGYKHPVQHGQQQQQQQQQQEQRHHHHQQEQQQQQQQQQGDDSDATHATGLHYYNTGCIGLVIVVLQMSITPVSYAMVALGSSDIYDQPWLTLALVAVAGTAVLAAWQQQREEDGDRQRRTPGTNGSSMLHRPQRSASCTLWYSLLASALCIAATTVRARPLLVAWEDVIASIIPAFALMAMALGGLLLSFWRRRCGGGGTTAVISKFKTTQGAMLAVFPVGVALQCAYSSFTMGDATTVSRIHLLAHAAGYVDLVCATAICNWTVAVLSGASLTRIGGQLLFSVAFFLVISLGHTSQVHIMSTVSLHLVLLLLRICMVNQRGMLYRIVRTVAFDRAADNADVKALAQLHAAAKYV